MLGIKSGWGGDYVNFAHSIKILAEDASENEMANEFYEKGITILSRVFKKHPKLANGRLFLRNAHRGRAELMEKMGRYEEAIANLKKAIELDSSKDRKVFQHRLETVIAKSKGLAIPAPRPKSYQKKTPLVAPRPGSVTPTRKD